IRELILPKLTTEVNLSKRYSALRQVYYSLIFSRWFKSRFANQTGKYASLIDRKDLTGLTSISAWTKTSFFNAYKKSFSQGEYNVKETVRTPTGQVIRSYFSGGIDVTNPVLKVAGVSLPGQASSAITKVLATVGLETPEGMKVTSSPVEVELGPYEAEFPKVATFAEIGKTIDVKGKVVLFSPDVNAPVKGGIISDPNNGRIVETGHSLKELLDAGAKVVLIFHQGRPGDPAFIENPDQHAEILNKLVGGNRVTSVNDLFGKVAIDAIKRLKSGQAVLLKQVRAKDSSTGKTLEENPWFVPTLRPLIDYFVLGGLSALGGESNRITGFHGVPTLADPLLVREIQDGRNALNPLKPNLAILGGSKIQKTDSVISQLSSNVGADMIVVGGVPAEAALVAAQMEKGKDYSDDELSTLATEVLGHSSARSLKVADDGKFFARLPALAKAIQDNPNRIALPKDMAYVDKDIVHSVNLVNGRVPKGFDLVLSGIGPKTDAYYASIINRADNPFQSAEWAGPLIDTRVDALLMYMTETAKAVSKMSVWSTGGGDTDEAIKRLGFKPPFRSLAGGAGQTFRNRKHIPGIDAAIQNSPEALKGKSFVPATDAEAHALSHTTVFNSLAQAMKVAGGKLVARTSIFNRGQAVGNIKISPIPMSTAIRLSLGDNSDVFAGMETMEIDGQNPWIDFSMTTLRTPMNDRRQISLDATRQILAKDPNIALILLQGEYNKKKDKFGDPGEVKTQSVEERLNAVLVKALRAKGINPASMPKAQRTLPAIVQVTQSTIPGQLKMATFVPTPMSDINRLMQLAQDSGINMKEFLEQSKEVNDAAFVDQMQDIKALQQITLLKEPLPLPPPMQKAAETELPGVNQLEGLTFGNGKINLKTQTIISRGSRANTGTGASFIDDLQSIINRVEQTGKLVRIMVPEDSDGVYGIKGMIDALIRDGSKGLTASMHSVVRGNEKFTAFIIAPKVSYVINGYGNEAIKVAPTLEAAGFGTPAVAINSL
ncbi:MAG: phosphoglycerate kinase, partial [Candidatus Omnitrophica bacterium]|nr:phosphoglycerate kinase [Candidatus Omnitrophota bacterium]